MKNVLYFLPLLLLSCDNTKVDGFNYVLGFVIIFTLLFFSYIIDISKRLRSIKELLEYKFGITSEEASKELLRKEKEKKE